jgi:soluble lytic murein transglycosylase-like protein
MQARQGKTSNPKMRIRFSAVPSGVALLVLFMGLPSLAQEKIQAVVTSNGRIVFTNLVVDNTPTPPPPVIKESVDVLAGEIPVALRTLVDTISVNHGVDPALVRAVIKTESNFNRWAVSRKGARGLMQLIPETGSRYGVRDFFDPQQNVEGGVQYLKFLLEKFNGNLDLSLAAYNAGENLVEKLGRIPPIPETTNYVRRVRANYVKRTAPVSAPTAKPAAVPAPGKSPVEQPVKEAKQETPAIYRTVDEHGVVHFSNVGPPN